MLADTYIAEDKKWKTVLEFVHLMADSRVTVLIAGEPGVGRRALAKFIHDRSRWSNTPFIAVSAGASSATDLAAALFGQGAGANAAAGTPPTPMPPIHQADGGTLLIQNIEDMPLTLQPMLLRLLQEGEFLLPGVQHPIRVRVRIMVTASPLLKEYVERGRFRADLFYRLHVLPISILPLRMRRDDILPLAKHFINVVYPDQRRDISVPAVERLLKYPWPGNVQELKNVITRACLLSKTATIDANDLSLEAIRPRPAAKQLVDELTSRLNDADRRLSTLRARTIVADPIWQGRRFSTRPNLCFVLMPFADTYDIQNVYREYVKPTVETCGLCCLRADDVYGVCGIMQSIWEAINQSRVIIADVTGRNPNVFYELGIAHTLGKPVVMMTQSIDDVPFDLKHLRCIVYEYKPRAIDVFRNSLMNTLTTVLETPASDTDV